MKDYLKKTFQHDKLMKGPLKKTFNHMDCGVIIGSNHNHIKSDEVAFIKNFREA